MLMFRLSTACCHSSSGRCRRNREFKVIDIYSPLRPFCWRMMRMLLVFFTNGTVTTCGWQPWKGLLGHFAVPQRKLAVNDSRSVFRTAVHSVHLTYFGSSSGFPMSQRYRNESFVIQARRSDKMIVTWFQIYFHGISVFTPKRHLLRLLIHQFAVIVKA